MTLRFFFNMVWTMLKKSCRFGKEGYPLSRGVDSMLILAECDLGCDQGVQQLLIKTEDWGETGKKSFRSARAARSSKQNKLGKIKALPMNQFRKHFIWWWSKTWGARGRLDILLPSPIKGCWNGPWYFNQTFKDISIRDAKAARTANLFVFSLTWTMLHFFFCARTV